ncbi:hypothetical protein PFICI_14849 [Pestalotiopsis fici W106-1]|uniref:Uncharacterized protein n=1 Tax=Pestalotiopsis fici (strain W106-1 / CGMCC3.15140) TaxID=1229662 RepID=W3WHJ7_PESFW|nr:uncharacterized protein PFICI_14849 [Pestalotiopsis fici W106-1]ETS73244.1 hypothetical protein PFICI_14849 [Pestalotiopsis fici W106-1]
MSMDTALALVQSANGLMSKVELLKGRMGLLSGMVDAALKNQPQPDGQYLLAGVERLTRVIDDDVGKFRGIVDEYESELGSFRQYFASEKVNLEASMAELHDKGERLVKERDQLEAQKQQFAVDKDQVEREQQQILDHKAQVDSDMETIRTSQATIEEERQQNTVARDEIKRQEEEFSHKKDQAELERQQHATAMSKEKEEIQAERAKVVHDQQTLAAERRELTTREEAVSNERAALACWQDSINRERLRDAEFKGELDTMQTLVAAERDEVAAAQEAAAVERRKIQESLAVVARGEEKIASDNANIARQQAEIDEQNRLVSEAKVRQDERDSRFKTTLEGVNQIILDNANREKAKHEDEIQSLRDRIATLDQEKLTESMARVRLEERLQPIQATVDELRQQLGLAKLSEQGAIARNNLSSDKLLEFTKQFLEHERNRMSQAGASRSQESAPGASQSQLSAPGASRGQESASSASRSQVSQAAGASRSQESAPEAVPQKVQTPQPMAKRDREMSPPQAQAVKKPMSEADKDKRQWLRMVQEVCDFLNTYTAIKSADSRPIPVGAAMLLLCISAASSEQTRFFMTDLGLHARTNEWVCLMGMMERGRLWRLAWIEGDNKSCPQHKHEECFQVRRSGDHELEYRLVGKPPSPDGPSAMDLFSRLMDEEEEEDQSEGQDSESDE